MDLLEVVIDRLGPEHYRVDGVATLCARSELLHLTEDKRHWR